MSENINIDVKGNESTSTSITNVSTPLVGISVKTETSNEEEKSQPISTVSEANKIDITFGKCCYFQWLLNEIFSFSTLLFLVAIGTIMFLGFGKFSTTDCCMKIIIGVFALLSLFFSVTTREKNDDTKWIRRSLFKLIIKERHTESLENLLKIMEL